MKKVSVLLLSTFLLIFTCTLSTVSGSSEAVMYAAIEDENTSQTQNIRCNFYNEKEFKASLNLVAAGSVKDGVIRGGIVPHHLLAGRLIASFFKTVSVQNPETVVVLAPNHKRLGSAKVNSGCWDWETPYGMLEADNGIIEYLEGNMAIDSSLKLLEEEHSISSLVPYIKYYMPDAMIVPILLYGNYGLQSSIRLGNELGKALCDKSCLIIASVDFSHYLSLEKADIMDSITLKAIEDMNLKEISQMGNDNLDSPPSIIALLTAMLKMDAESHTVLEHSNSDRISGIESGSTTSYFTMVFSKLQE